METYLMNLLAVCPSSKQQLMEWSDKLKNSIFEGEINGIDAKKMYIMFEKLLQNIKPLVDELALEEAEKYGSKDFEANNMRLTIKEAGVKYDFDHCGDPIYNQYNSNLESEKAKLKEREKFLRAITKPIEVYIGDGEVVTINPPNKQSKTVLTAQLL